MKLLSAHLVPFKDISGAGPRWIATSDDAWFELQTDAPLAGCCLRLDWSAGLFEPVSRVVLRYVIGDRNDDIILGAASFGRGQWTGQVPAGTSRILLSPVHSPGEFGFRIDRLTRLSFAEMMARAFRRRPLNALLSLTARLRGWRQASESELRDVFLTTDLAAYDAWRRERLRPVETDIDGAPTVAEIDQPHIFILPLAGPDMATVRAHADALGRQDRANWSLHVVLPTEHLAATTDAFGQNPRVQFIAQDVVLADHLRSLPAQALLHVLRRDAWLSPLFTRTTGAAAQRHPSAVLFYGDEDRRTADDTRYSPSFKGDFDPVLIGTLDYIGAANVWRVGRLGPYVDADARIGAARTALTEAAKTLARADVVHLARVLVTLSADEKPTTSSPRRTTTVPIASANEDPFISIVIPTRDYPHVLKPCVESLFRFASRPFELIIVDNGSVEPQTLAYFDDLRKKPRAHILRADHPFNFSDLCNRGAAIATTPRLLFLNNDTEFLSAGWEAQIAPYLDDPTIGAIGAKLLYRNRRVQHAGVIAGLHGRAGHFEIGMSEDAAGYFRRANHAHALLAVTGAALAVRRDAFDAIGGFDAEHLPVDLNDIDFCLRLMERGFTNLYLPQWVLFHDESVTRGLVHESDRIYGGERHYFCKRWLNAIRNDPYFNPNLSLWRTAASLG